MDHVHSHTPYMDQAPQAWTVCVQILRGTPFMPCAVNSFFKPIYRSLSRDQSYRLPYLHISFDINWLSRFKSEITAFWIWTLDRFYLVHFELFTCNSLYASWHSHLWNFSCCMMTFRTAMISNIHVSSWHLRWGTQRSAAKQHKAFCICLY